MVKVIQTDPPVEKEVLADAIVRVSNSMKALSDSGLTQRTIVALVHDHTGLPKKTITRVITSLAELKSAYCK